MRKNVTIRVLCLVVALVVLGGAVAFAAVMGSPYETFKRAMFDAGAYTNVTFESHMTLTANGIVQQEVKTHVIASDNSSLTYFFDENGVQSGFSYYADGLSLFPSSFSEENTWYYVYVSPPNQGNYRSYISGLSMFSPDYRNSAEMRFMELVIDALVGDLKNNITMSTGDGVRIIRGTLTENQVPELVKAGIDVLIEQSSDYYHSFREISFDGREYIYESIRLSSGMKTVVTWMQAVRPMTAEEEEAWNNGTYYDVMGYDHWGVADRDDGLYINEGPNEILSEYTVPAVRSDYETDNPLELPLKSLVVNYVRGEAVVDADGNLLSIDANGVATVTDIFGETHEVEVKLTLRLSDIGTSNPVCPIPGVEQLLNSEYAKTHFGREYMEIYFTLNPDGSIDASSVTDTYPGDMVTQRFRSGPFPYLSSSMASSSIITVAAPVPMLPPDLPAAGSDDVDAFVKNQDIED